MHKDTRPISMTYVKCVRYLCLQRTTVIVTCACIKQTDGRVLSYHVLSYHRFKVFSRGKLKSTLTKGVPWVGRLAYASVVE